MDFSRGRRGARAGFSFGSCFSFGSLSFLGLTSGSSSFLRRDRLAVPEARRALVSGLGSDSTGRPSVGTTAGSVDIVVHNCNLIKRMNSDESGQTGQSGQSGWNRSLRRVVRNESWGNKAQIRKIRVEKEHQKHERDGKGRGNT